MNIVGLVEYKAGFEADIGLRQVGVVTVVFDCTNLQFKQGVFAKQLAESEPKSDAIIVDVTFAIYVSYCHARSDQWLLGEGRVSGSCEAKSRGK